MGNGSFWISHLALAAVIAAGCGSTPPEFARDSGPDSGGCIDQDQDGFCGPLDCDDADPSVPGPSEDEAWYSESPAPAAGTEAWPDGIAVEPDGSLQAVYNVGPVMHRARRESSGWTDDAATLDGRAYGFAIDETGVAHVAYIGTTALRYANDALGKWRSEDVGARAVGLLALGSDGEPHVAFNSDGTVFHATKAGAAWDIEEVAPAGSWPEIQSLAMTADGAIHILETVGEVAGPYDTCPTAYRALHFTNESGSWTQETVGEAEDVRASRGTIVANPDSGLDLVLFEEDFPPALERECADPTRKIGYYLRRVDGQWEIELEFPEPADRPIDLAVDAAGRPHLIVNGVYWTANESGEWIADEGSRAVIGREVRLVAGTESLHVLSVGIADEGLIYSYRALADGRDGDCDGIL